MEGQQGSYTVFRGTKPSASDAMRVIVPIIITGFVEICAAEFAWFDIERLLAS